jgi:hypothetical protein
MRVKKGVEIKQGNKSFVKTGNNFYALYLNGHYVGNCLYLKEARSYLR